MDGFETKYCVRGRSPEELFRNIIKEGIGILEKETKK
jgi:hypothetical protein